MKHHKPTEKIIACDTCKWSGGSRCNNAHHDCLHNSSPGPVVRHYLIFLRKNQPDFDYAHWEPAWIEPNPLPDDLFEL